MNLPTGFCNSSEKFIAARSALVAKYTLETLRADQRQSVDEQIVDLLILSGVNASRAPRYRCHLRETQYYGMAALAMAFLDIRPALTGILLRERWEHVKNPLVALTGAHLEIQLASNEIMQKHRILVIITDEDRRAFKWDRLISERETEGNELSPDATL
jgi:hypothetical protein